MIEICLQDDNMHIFIMINALICINNYVITCINSMLSTTETDTTETDSSFDQTEPVEMARNDEGNAKKCLSDYARPVLQRPVTRIHAPLGRGENFRIDSHVMSILLIFHGKPSEDPYRHID